MYSLVMINRNGYTIKKQTETVKQAKEFASWYPLDSFFCWIYNCSNDEMKYQNEYRKTWKKVDNENFIPYY